MWTSLFTRHIIRKNYFHGLRIRSTSTNATPNPKLYILQYDYVPDALEKRMPYREAHLAFIGKHVENGNVILGGAIDNPPTGGLIILRHLSVQNVEQLARQDPYVINGIVKQYTIKPYMAVVGDSLLKNDLIKI